MTGRDSDTLGPKVISVVIRISECQKSGSSVPRAWWAELHSALAERLGPEILDSDLGREVVRELMRRAYAMYDGRLRCLRPGVGPEPGPDKTEYVMPKGAITALTGLRIEYTRVPPQAQYPTASGSGTALPPRDAAPGPGCGY